MTDLFLERKFDPPITPQDVIDLAVAAGGCFDLHSVDWGGSLLADDGATMSCHFIGRDAESIRIALRQINTDMRVAWTATVHDRPGLTAEELLSGNVIVMRSFSEPVEFEAIQAIEDAGAWCLQAWNVTFLRTWFSMDRTRMACLYRAPDAESVRNAQRQAEMPFEDVWSVRQVGPGDVVTQA